MPHPHVQEHIELIARHEQEFLARRTPAERRVDAIAGFIGSLPFVLMHLALFTLWVLWNALPHLPHFDPRPFSLLQTCVAMEALLAASFILIRQNRLARRADERDHLVLQVLLLSEKEITTVLNVERQIATKLGLEKLANSPELEELSRDTPIEKVAQVIQQTITDNESGESSAPVAGLGLSGERGEDLQ
jgi:uncharacterized membrane protein